MKKYNSILNNKLILYLLFILTLANLSYFIFIKDNYSILIFSLIAILIYLFTTNMIIVLGLSIFIINLLVLARDSREGFESPNDCNEFRSKVETNMFSSDMSDSDISGVTVPKKFKDDYEDFKLAIKRSATHNSTDSGFYDDYMIEYNKIKNEELSDWLDKHIANVGNFSSVCKTKGKGKGKESLKNELDNTSEIKEIEESDKILNSMIEKVKKNSPEMEESLKVLKGIDMNELNKLINKLNSFSDVFTGTNK
jgi:hypothetical protein